MDDRQGARERSPRRLAYCTNVHAGESLVETRANLERHALAVKRDLAPNEPLGVGLWLSARAVRELLSTNGTGAFARWLCEQGLEVFTLNGFPFGDFHRPVVKHLVYEPHWGHPDRLAYTLDLVRMLAELLPAGGEGSISTLPIGWRPSVRADAVQEAAAQQILKAVEAMAALAKQGGPLIHLDLEPEPGCLLERSADVVEFFERWLLPLEDRTTLLRHLRVCHDVCHAAVMFEDQEDILRRYDAAGLSIGKVQISSAVEARFDGLSPGQRHKALEQLRGFAEPRYLHQTVIRLEAERRADRFYPDLPLALQSAAPPGIPCGHWRVHFHVPIFAKDLGLLQTTRSEITRCLELLGPRLDVHHYEVETYAWSVLPAAMYGGELAAGIARELRWLRDHVAPEFFA